MQTNTQQYHWQQCTIPAARSASFSNSGNCVVVGFCAAPVCGNVHVYDDKPRKGYHRPIVLAFSPGHWQQLVNHAKATGELDLEAWFGSMALRFTAAEISAFRQGVLAGEFDLVRMQGNLHQALVAA